VVADIVIEQQIDGTEECGARRLLPVTSGSPLTQAPPPVRTTGRGCQEKSPATIAVPGSASFSYFNRTT
jgi:hypothetical protein